MDLTVTAVFWRMAGLFALVFANGFFVAAEFAIVTVRKTRVDQLIAEGHRGARAVRRAVTDARSLHRRDAARHHDGEPGPGLDRRAGARLASSSRRSRSCRRIVADATAHSVAVAIAFTIITGVADRVRRADAEDGLRSSAPRPPPCGSSSPLELFMRGVLAVHPRGARHGTGRRQGCSACTARIGHAMVHSEEELKMLVTASQEAGVLEENEEQMLHRVFGFADLTAGQIMTPRTEIVAVAADTPRDVAHRAAWSAAATRGCRSTGRISTM